MDSPKKFFHKYILSSILLIIFFIIINLALILFMAPVIRNYPTKITVPLYKIAEGIHIDDKGIVAVEDNTVNLLTKEASWAMLLDKSGNVIWENRLPDDLPRTYTSSDIATFSHWYLNDYPVFIHTIDTGILVVGYPPDSMIKINIVTPHDFLSLLLRGSTIILIINTLLVIILFWLNSRKLEKAVVPVLHGISDISQGKEVSLPEKGELNEINSAVNRTSQNILKKDKARAEWISGISHDVRTPLSIMLGYAGEIEDNNQNSQSTCNQARIIRIQGEKLRSLISDLNLTSKLEYSMQPLKLEVIYPTELVRLVVSEFLNNGLDDKYDIDFYVSEGMCGITLMGDLSLLKRMLSNLIQNSISHNQDGCHISIAVSVNNKVCQFVVGDDGIGITKNQKEQFNLGTFSSKASEQNGEMAHGFGLKLVYQIIHAHNGKLIFEDNMPNGLIVKIFLNL